MKRVRKTYDFKLSAEEFNFLRQIFAHDQGLAGLFPRDVEMRGDTFTIGMDRAEAERVREDLTKRLAECGFDKDYAPTKRGQMLEDLIDRFYLS